MVLLEEGGKEARPKARQEPEWAKKGVVVCLPVEEEEEGAEQNFRQQDQPPWLKILSDRNINRPLKYQAI